MLIIKSRGCIIYQRCLLENIMIKLIEVIWSVVGGLKD